MWIASTAWGFWRSGESIGGSFFGPRVAQIPTGGDHDSPLLNDIESGDAAAGVEFCAVFEDLPSSGTLTFDASGVLRLIGAADGVHIIPYSLFTWTPGDAASEEATGSPTTYTVNVGATAAELVSTGGRVAASGMGALTVKADLSSTAQALQADGAGTLTVRAALSSTSGVVSASGSGSLITGTTGAALASSGGSVSASGAGTLTTRATLQATLCIAQASASAALTARSLLTSDGGAAAFSGRGVLGTVGDVMLVSSPRTPKGVTYQPMHLGVDCFPV